MKQKDAKSYLRNKSTSSAGLLSMGKKTFQNGKYKVTQFLQQHLHFGLTVIARTAEGTEGSQPNSSREASYQRTCQAGFQYPTR